MKITSLVRVNHMKDSVAFYTGVLDFTVDGSWPDFSDPAFCVLRREDAELYLSSHRGDGVFGNVVSLMVPELDALFAEYVRRGLDPSKKSESPVHQGPIDQSWGTREFYVSDPDGNTLRYIENKHENGRGSSRTAQCLPFLRVPDVGSTVDWYKQIGFVCLATHEEPGCGLDWALMDWRGAQFMLYPEGQTTRDKKDAGLYFVVDSIDSIVDTIKANAGEVEINPQTEYGKKEIVFRDVNGFQVTFGCDI
ncbi:MAG TPA: glyoxalase superfamily protein [Chryseolinea sp.]|nr:glyoxalase superfamily protein [Chryseolinea sp.]